MATSDRQSRGRRRMLSGVGGVVGTAAIVVSVTVVASGPPEPLYGPVHGDGAGETAPSASGWRLNWADEFNGEAGATPDPVKWEVATGGGGWGNEELQYYTGSADNVAMDGNGHLAITAREVDGDRTCWYGPCRYTSARILTEDTFAQQYGLFTARIKLPGGQGLWPAFWMLGDNLDRVGYPQCGEIDIMENIGSRPSTVHGSLHSPGYDFTGDYRLPPGSEFADEFHTFTVKWSKTSIRFYVDGTMFQELTKREVGSGWVFDHEFFLLLNVAVGGTWPGRPDEETRFPQRMLVDYVRVYERSGEHAN